MERGLISVDRWSEDSQAYFLTHLHADHTRGLSSDWARGPVFCSPVTAALLPSKFPGFDLSLLRVLEVGNPRSLALTSRATGSEVSVRVTAIDSCHCPGSVMYLFQGDLGCVLHSGDFRWEMTDERAWLGKKALLSVLGEDTVDVLYLDNTFCNPTFDFPPREVAARQVVDIISCHPNHDIVIGIDTLGKEDLLVQISEATNTKIWVWPERLQTMHLLGLDRIFTTKTQLTRVRAIPRYSFTMDTLTALNSVHPTIGIMPSGLPWSPKPDDCPSLGLPPAKSLKPREDPIGCGGRRRNHPERCHPCIYSVLYSAHCLRPSKVTGTVPSSFCYVNPWHFFGHLCTSDRPSDGGSPPAKIRRSEAAPPPASEESRRGPLKGSEGAGRAC
ncbi:unnamed protein product [Spirodela intermedia]|uniref:Uncharacterized protein n=1 Tax=Spirodela intermedia TaxID=51605 RepID=A0A7I8IMM2_SPIIN|nr:unnamed protein product [Spirodela intermedia]CAA6658385.1 unnamed protein product [Spirodela intermedia]